MGGHNGGGGREGRGSAGQPGEVVRAANQANFNSQTASATELTSRLVEQRQLRNKIDAGKATEVDKARDKELYLQMKGANKNPNWDKAYGGKTGTGLYQQEVRRLGLGL